MRRYALYRVPVLVSYCYGIPLVYLVVLVFTVQSAFERHTDVINVLLICINGISLVVVATRTFLVRIFEDEKYVCIKHRQSIHI